MIFYPFDINEMEDQIIEYHGELDPDSNYFNQFSHRLNKSSNYYVEDSCNKYIKRNCHGRKKILSFTPVSGVFQPTTSFMSYMSNINYDFSAIGFSETWIYSSNIDTYGIDGYSHVGITRESGKGGGVSLFISDDIVYCELSEFNMMYEYIECVFIEMNHRAH